MATAVRVDFHEQDTDSAAFMILRPSEATIALGFGVEVDGDLDLVVSHADARRLGQCWPVRTASAVIV